MRYVYCHPLFDERKCAARFSFELERAFERDGLTLERFDYRGTGEAEGDFADVSLDTLGEDVAAQAGSEHVCLVGLRFGATLAFEYGRRNGGSVERLVLLAPIVDGAAYVDYLYRKQRIKDLLTGETLAELGDEGYCNLEGFKTSTRLIEQIKALNLVDFAESHSAGTAVILCEIGAGRRCDDQTAGFARSLERTGGQIVAERVQMPTFWERIPNADYGELTEKVLSWCRG